MIWGTNSNWPSQDAKRNCIPLSVESVNYFAILPKLQTDEKLPDDRMPLWRRRAVVPYPKDILSIVHFYSSPALRL